MVAPRIGQGGVVTAKGDIMAFNGSDAERLPIGPDGYQLFADSTTSTGLLWSNGGVLELTISIPLSSAGTFTGVPIPVGSNLAFFWLLEFFALGETQAIGIDVRDVLIIRNDDGTERSITPAGTSALFVGDVIFGSALTGAPDTIDIEYFNLNATEAVEAYLRITQRPAKAVPLTLAWP